MKYDPNKIAAVIVLALLLCAGLWLARPMLLPKEQTIATISVDGETITVINLWQAPDSVFSIEDKTGIPITFEVKDGGIRFASSSCPDKICVNTGFISHGQASAVCLPNKTAVFTEIYK